MLDVQRLRVLRELDQRGTLAAVAAALGYSPSAISQQLAQLEREAGVSLLERVGRRVKLTAAASRLVGHADRILAQLEEAQADLADAAAGNAGTVRLAMFESAAHALLPAALKRLARTAPSLTVTVDVVEPETALPALSTHDLDLVVAEEYPGQPLRRDRNVDLFLLLADPLLLAQPTGVVAPNLEDLAEAGWIMEPSGTRPRTWAESVCRAAGFEPRVQFQSIDLSLHAALVQTGRAVAFLPRLVGRVHGGVDLSALPGRPHRSIFTAVRHGSERHPHIQAVREALIYDVDAPVPHQAELPLVGRRDCR